MSPNEPTSARITRLGHKKSRHGCLRCKLRHVKCDEQQPCRNCIRYNAACSLVQTSRSAFPRAIASRGPPPMYTQDLTPPLDNSSPPSVSSDASLVPKPVVGPENSTTSQSHRHAHGIADNGTALIPEKKDNASLDWMRSLKLLNHYHISTCLTLHHDSATLHLWRTVVPGLAVSHEFLMHGLLALSALHYAHVHPDERRAYLRLSTGHQDRALKFFSTNLTHINDGNCEAYFVLSILIFLLATWSIANPAEREEPANLETVLQVFALTQGVKGIIEFPAKKKWREGFLSPLFAQWATPPIDPLSPFARQLDKLAALVQTIHSDEDEASATLCRAGLESLRRAYALHRSVYSGRHRTWMWRVELEKQRFDFTSSRHPIAIIILAHCAALVNCSEGPSWLWDGWGASVVNMAERELSQEWQHWLQWPLRCIRDALDVDAMGD